MFYVLSTRIKWDRKPFRYGAFFVGYAVLVSIFNFILYGDPITLASSTYYIYNFLIFIFVSSLLFGYKEALLKKILRLHLLLLVLLLFLLAFQSRAIYISRYTASFNDPNQLGHYVLWAIIISYIGSQTIYRSRLYGLIALLLGALIILYSASRSAAIGLFFIVIAIVFLLLGDYLPINLAKKKAPTSVQSRRLITELLVILIFLGSFIYLYREGLAQTQNIGTRYDYLKSRFVERDADDSLEGRGYDRIWKFPIFLLFGAGEGATDRFASKCYFLGEIHSTWAGLLFNYGIIGSTLFLAFIWSIFRSLKEKRIFALTLGPFIYGFFTYNLRNWYFWVGLAVIYSSSFMWRGHLRKHVINGIVQARPNMLYKASKNATNIRTSCPEDSR